MPWRWDEAEIADDRRIYHLEAYTRGRRNLEAVRGLSEQSQSLSSEVEKFLGEVRAG